MISWTLRVACFLVGFTLLFFRLADGLRCGERYAVYGLCAHVPLVAVTMLAQWPFYKLTLAEVFPSFLCVCAANALLTWPPLPACFRNWRNFK